MDNFINGDHNKEDYTGYDKTWYGDIENLQNLG